MRRSNSSMMRRADHSLFAVPVINCNTSFQGSDNNSLSKRRATVPAQPQNRRANDTRSVERLLS